MRIRWTDLAANDLTSICDYLEQYATAAIAERVAKAIFSNIDQLARFPELGRTGRRAETRELVLAHLPYIAVYRLNQGRIEILRILHGAQRWPE